MTIDTVSDSDSDSFSLYDSFARAISWNESAPQGVLHDLSIYAHRAGSYLIEPAFKVHELYRYLSVVDVLNPDSHPLINMVTKISLYVAMAGWFSIACLTTLPAIGLRFLGVQLQNTPFIYMQAPGAYPKNLPENRTFSFLTWNVCCVNGGFSITDAGVVHWTHRIDTIIDRIVQRDADIVCLNEIFDINTGFYLYDKLQDEGYDFFYFNVGAPLIGISSGLFVASKYKIENPEFTRFPLDTLVGRTKGCAKGVFAFDLYSEEECFARIFSTHPQHSEVPQFPTSQEVEARRQQMRIVLEQVDKIQARNRAIVVAGDMNFDDEEHHTSFWCHHFEKLDFGAADKTWGGDAFCSQLIGREISGSLNLDHIMFVPGTCHSIEHGLIKTDFDSTTFTPEALSDHQGLWVKIRC